MYLLSLHGTFRNCFAQRFANQFLSVVFGLRRGVYATKSSREGFFDQFFCMIFLPCCAVYEICIPSGRIKVFNGWCMHSFCTGAGYSRFLGTRYRLSPQTSQYIHDLTTC